MTGLRGKAEHGGDCLPGALPGQQVDDLLVGDRHEKGDGLGDDERHQGQDHAHAEIGTAGRPDIGEQLAQDREVPRPRLKHGVASRLRQPILHEKGSLPIGGTPGGKKGSAERCPCAYSPRAAAPPSASGKARVSGAEKRQKPRASEAEALRRGRGRCRIIRRRRAGIRRSAREHHRRPAAHHARGRVVLLGAQHVPLLVELHLLLGRPVSVFVGEDFHQGLLVEIDIDGQLGGAVPARVNFPVSPLS